MIPLAEYRSRRREILWNYASINLIYNLANRTRCVIFLIISILRTIVDTFPSCFFFSMHITNLCRQVIYVQYLSILYIIHDLYAPHYNDLAILTVHVTWLHVILILTENGRCEFVSAQRSREITDYVIPTYKNLTSFITENKMLDFGSYSNQNRRWMNIPVQTVRRHFQVYSYQKCNRVIQYLVIVGTMHV